MAKQGNPNTLRVAFVGAGPANFGGAVGPWDHASRLERLGGVVVVAIADPIAERAQKVLKQRRAGPYGSLYADCRLFDSHQSLVASDAQFDVAFVAVPPTCHGDGQKGHDVELACLQRGAHVLVEKPLSCVAPEVLQAYADHVVLESERRQLVLSVGYMFRYHAAVLRAKQVLDDHFRRTGCAPVRLSVSFNNAYFHSSKPYWWDTRQSGGPIVEQATHMCDIARFLGGDVLLNTVQAMAIRADDRSGLGQLRNLRADLDAAERKIPSKWRAPRLTCASWRFTNGALGSLTHGVALGGRRYEASVQVWADGLRLTLSEPYFPDCELRIRQGDTDSETVERFAEEDAYESEMVAFVKAIRTGACLLAVSLKSNASIVCVLIILRGYALIISLSCCHGGSSLN